MTNPRFVPALLFPLLTACVALGQTFTGTILGTVRDSSSAVVQAAKITVVETETGLRRATTSGKDGYFEVPLLPPGSYQIEGEMAGFKKFVRSGLRLEI